MSRIQPHSAEERRIIWWTFWAAVLTVLADQAVKLWVERGFLIGESWPVIPGILSWTSVRNRGAAWSILSGYGWILLLAALLVVSGIIRFFRSLTEGCPERFIALGVILGGVFGNSIDRLWRGAVVDFIDVHYHNVWHYPVFNVADIAICCGVGIFLLSNLFRKSPVKE